MNGKTYVKVDKMIYENLTSTPISEFIMFFKPRENIKNETIKITLERFTLEGRNYQDANISKEFYINPDDKEYDNQILVSSKIESVNEKSSNTYEEKQQLQATGKSNIFLKLMIITVIVVIMIVIYEHIRHFEYKA